jgi:hypothetical protein
VSQNLIAERANGLVIALNYRIANRADGWNIASEFATLSNPLGTATVEDTNVFVAE